MPSSLEEWRRKWQPTPVLLPGESHGWRSLVGYSPWGHEESDMSRTWLRNFTFTFHFGALEKKVAIHSSVLAWRIPVTEERRAAVYGVAESRTRLKWMSSSSSFRREWKCSFFRLLTVGISFQKNVTKSVILELSFDSKKETHIWLTYMSVDTENYDSFTLVMSILVMVHIMHLGGGFSLQVLIMRLAHPSGQSYSMSFL